MYSSLIAQKLSKFGTGKASFDKLVITIKVGFNVLFWKLKEEV